MLGSIGSIWISQYSIINQCGGIIPTWRLIDTDLSDPYFVTAADEALAIGCGEPGAIPTLHFYRRDPPAISLGYFRKVEDDVNIEKCEELGIKIVRRTSAGGSIYTDKHQLIFGLITPYALGNDVEDTFKKVCGGIINALAELDIPSKFKKPNDITINDKKISGSAQVKKKFAYIIHSTVILALDNRIIDQVLKNAKPGYTSSIQHEMGFKPDIDLMKTAIKTAFQNTFGVSFINEQFSRTEKILIDDLIKNKYGSKAWNFKR